MARLFRGTILLVALAFAMGNSTCSTLSGALDLTGEMRRLDETQKKYVHYLRWGEYRAAAMLVEKDSREAFLNQVEPLSQVRLSDYEILETIFSPDGTECTLTVTFSAYNVTRLVEHTWMEDQVWVKEPGTRNWKVKPDFEKMKKALSEMHVKS